MAYVPASSYQTSTSLQEDNIIKGSCHCGDTYWLLSGPPGSITACNCTLCVRYGALWAYDYEGERVSLHGQVSSYTRVGKTDPTLEIKFCHRCACVLSWRGLRVDAIGRRRMAVNIRLAPAEAVASLPIDHFDGLDTFEDLPSKGKCVQDYWF